MKPNDGFAKLKDRFITGCCQQGLNHEDLLFRLFMQMASVTHIDDPSKCIEDAIKEYKGLISLKDHMHAEVSTSISEDDPDKHLKLVECHQTNSGLLYHYKRAVAGEAKIKIEE